MGKKVKIYIGIFVVAVMIVAGAIVYNIWRTAPHDGIPNQDEAQFGMVIPDAAMFVDAPSAETDPVFDVTFSYNDNELQESVQGNAWQKIHWSLAVYPKEGAEAKDVYCTLILGDWILARSSSADLKYMGAARGVAGDIPGDTKGIAADMVKYVDAQVLNDPFYEEAMTTPVNIMLGYNGEEKYYTITPSRDTK